MFMTCTCATNARELSQLYSARSTCMGKLAAADNYSDCFGTTNLI